MSFTALALALVAATSAAPELGAQSLVSGSADQALLTLERSSADQPRDAAVLINLGIAYAQKGDEARARAAFEAAAACEDTVELATIDGNVTDSQRLARKALKMLARGEFRSAGARAAQLTRRD